MELVGRLVLLVHLLGFASLVGGLLVQARSSAPEVNAAMLYGAWLELLSGAGLVVLLVLGRGDLGHGDLGHSDLSYPQLATKLVLTVMVVVLVGKNRRFLSIPRGLWFLITLLSVGSAGVAVLWQ